MKVTKLTLLLLAAFAALPLMSCGGSDKKTESSGSTETAAPAAANDKPVYGGKFVTYHTEFYNTFDPDSSTIANFVSFYSDMLWNLDWNTDRSKFNFSSSYIDIDHISGQIAKDWSYADDYSSLTVKIRDDVYFQDKTAAGMDGKYDIYHGRQLKAGDVKYTYDRLLGLDGVPQVKLNMTSWPMTLAMLKSVQVVDDYTVKFNFKTSNKLAVDSFMTAFVNIVGPEWDKLSEAQKNDWHYASGTGPFMLTDYSGDNNMTFTRNKKYWDTDADGNPLPYLDEVQLVYMPDRATVLSSFMAGELDAIINNFDIINTDQVKQLKNSMSKDDYYQYRYFGKPAGVMLKQGNKGLKPLADKKVREALQMAVDVNAISDFAGYHYDSIDQKLCGVFAIPTPWNDIHAWPDGLIESYTTYDPEKAKQILKEEGYGDGFSFDFVIFQMMPVEPFQLMAQYLAKVGVTMNISVVATPNEMNAIGGDPNNPGCQFGSLGIDNASMFAITIPYKGFNNTIKQNDPEIDKLAAKFMDATNAKDQIVAAKELDKVFMSEHYLLMSTYSEQTSCWFRSYVHGLHGESPGQNYYFGFMAARMWVTNH